MKHESEIMNKGTQKRSIFSLIQARFLPRESSAQYDGMSKAKNQSIFTRVFSGQKSSVAFTLIEVLVSVSIFAIVMLIATGAVFSIVEANKKTHSLKSVMTNLNFALESMARDMRVGFNYRCDGVGDCISGGSVFIYKANRDVDGDGSYNSGDSNDQIEYSLSGERLMKRVYSNGQAAIPITASEIHILSMKFYLVGSGVDGKQPKVLITIQGYAGSDQTRSDFNIETTVSQRSIDS